MLTRTIAAALSTLALVGCNSIAVKGTGTPYEADRSINAVTEVAVKGNGQLVLKNGSTPSLTVIAQREIHEHLVVEQIGNRLIIKPEEGHYFKSNETIQYVLVMNNLDTVDISGAVNVISERYETDQLLLDVSGASDIDMTVDATSVTVDASGSFDGYLSGQANDLTLNFSGAADLNAFDLVANDVDIRISGAGYAYVTALERLNVSASGAGHVEYKGSPRVSQSTSGASSVIAVQ